MAAGRDVRYARTDDGLDIAYTITGSGPDDVVVVHGFTTHLDLMWDFPWHAAWDRHLAEHFRVITFDKRGTGLSDRSLGFGSIEDRSRDIVAVMDAARSDRAALVGISEGAPMSLVMAATHRERVTRMALYGGFARLAWAPDYPDGLTPDVMESTVQLIGDTWGQGQIFGSLFLEGPEDLVPLMAQFERNACTRQMAQHVMEANFRVDVRPLLGTITAPTLVIQNSDDPLIWPAWGRAVADAIPNAQYQEFSGAFHCTSYLDRAIPRINAAVGFLTGDVSSSAEMIPPSRTLATVLFVDIVGSTERAATLRDEAWKDVLAHFATLAEASVARLRGRLVKSTGDGFLAVFDGPSRGIECAQAVREAVKSLGLSVRSGVHTGEIEDLGGDVGGIGVHIAARAMSSADDDEIWVTRTVRDLTIGSSIEFKDRGVHSLKGVPDTWQLYSVLD